MTTVADLSPEQQADLYDQVGDAMYASGFSYDGHISANTVNGVFNRPDNNPPADASSGTVAITPTSSIPSNVTTSNGASSIAQLTPSQLTDLYSQVGDAMYASGFSYEAHIAANIINGVFVAPVYIPANTESLLTKPALGTQAYERLLIETGGASANSGFNYAAHLAATVSQSRADLSYDDVIRIIAESGKTDFVSFDLEAYRASTGSTVGVANGYANSIVASVASRQIQETITLSLPAVGSAQYLALSIETGGASESPGFNYVAHIAAITSQTILTSLSYAEVVALIAETGRSDFTNFDLVSYQQEKINTDFLLNRFLINPANLSDRIPEAGTAAYLEILTETGLETLENFDYATYLSAKRDAQLAITTLQLTSDDDVVIATPDDIKSIFVAGAGDDQITATFGADVLIGGAGSDILDGSVGLDQAVFSGSLADYRINFVDSQAVVADSDVTRDGTDTLINVERLSFADTALALDIGADQTAGSIYMLYQATFNRTPDADGIGYWIDRVDQGADITNEVASFFTTSNEFVEKYGSNPSNASYVDNLYLNVLGRAGEAGGVDYWNQELNAGRVSKAYVLEQFATLAEGEALVAPAIANGIQYTQWTG